jgi:hypothetical protein
MDCYYFFDNQQLVMGVFIEQCFWFNFKNVIIVIFIEKK